MQLRAARADELDALSRIWYDAWQDGHADVLPAALRQIRTIENFRERLLADISGVRVAELRGEAVGFCLVQGDELYQLFVSARARGTGVAAALLADGEARMQAAGEVTAWLACAIGNQRAARFYEKAGWRKAGVMTSRLPVPADAAPGGVFELEVWRFEKPLRPPPGS